MRTSQSKDLGHTNPLKRKLNFNELPLPVLFEIITCLSPWDVMCLSLVSRSMNAVSNIDSYWKGKLQQYFPTLASSFADNYKGSFISLFGDAISSFLKEVELRGWFNELPSEKFFNKECYHKICEHRINKNKKISKTVKMFLWRLLPYEAQLKFFFVSLGGYFNIQLNQFLEKNPNDLNLIEQAKKNEDQRTLALSSKIIKKLIDEEFKGIPIYLRHGYITSVGYSCLHWAILCNNTNYFDGYVKNAESSILGLKIPVDQGQEQGLQALHLAAKRGNLKIVKCIVMKDTTTIDGKDTNDQTPLFWAIHKGHMAVTTYLINQGSDLSFVLSQGCRRGDKHLVKTLLDNFYNQLNLKESFETAEFQVLHYAAKKGHLEIVKLILEKDKSTLNEKDKFGQTALIWAAVNGHANMVQYLINQGADLGVATNDSEHDCILGKEKEGSNNNKTALCWAAEKGHKDVVNVLLTAMRTRGELGDKKPLSLHLALYCCLLKTVGACQEVEKQLKAAGANLEVLLRWAIENKKESLVSRDLSIWGRALERLLSRLIETGDDIVAQDLVKSLLTFQLEKTCYYNLLFSEKVSSHLGIVKIILESYPEFVNPVYYDVENYGQTPLYWAIKKGHKTVETFLIKQGANLNVALSVAMGFEDKAVVGVILDVYCDQLSLFYPFRLMSPSLHFLATHGQLANIKKILTNHHDGTNIKHLYRDTDGRTPLMNAAANGHIDVVEFFIALGEDLEAGTSDYKNDDEFSQTGSKTALFLAVEQGHEALAVMLVNRGANLKRCFTQTCFQVLHFAAKRNMPKLVQVILQKDPTTLNDVDTYGETPLMTALHCSASLPLVDCLIQNKLNLHASINNPGEKNHGQTALYMAVQYKKWEIVEQLIKAIKKEKNGLKRALDWALEHKHNEVVVKLAKAGADLEQIIYSAIGDGNKNFAKQLINDFSDVLNFKKCFEKTELQVLHYASEKGYLEIVQTIIKADKTTLNARDKNNQTPLIWAASRGHDGVVSHLLKIGADPWVATSHINPDASLGEHHGKTALSWACQGKLESTIVILMQKMYPQVFKQYNEKLREIRLLEFNSADPDKYNHLFKLLKNEEQVFYQRNDKKGGKKAFENMVVMFSKFKQLKPIYLELMRIEEKKIAFKKGGYEDGVKLVERLVGDIDQLCQSYMKMLNFSLETFITECHNILNHKDFNVLGQHRGRGPKQVKPVVRLFSHLLKALPDTQERLNNFKAVLNQLKNQEEELEELGQEKPSYS